MGYSSLTDIQLKILEYIHGRPEQEADYSDVETHLGDDLIADLEHLADIGLLQRDSRSEGFYHLTVDGRAEVDAMLKRREDRSYRRTQCRARSLVVAALRSRRTVGANRRPR